MVSIISVDSFHYKCPFPQVPRTLIGSTELIRLIWDEFWKFSRKFRVCGCVQSRLDLGSCSYSKEGTEGLGDTLS